MRRLGGAYEVLSCAALVVGDKVFFGGLNMYKNMYKFDIGCKIERRK
jgi:hypothetical protein